MSKREMSADELSACRKRLEHLWKSRAVDEGLLRRAWSTAHQVAALLYEPFKATHVYVFGSLTEPRAFTERSDIDIAVAGLSANAYDRAWTQIVNLDSEFKIDLINFDMSESVFRERIKAQAIPIEKGIHRLSWKTQVFPDEEIYEMNRERLTHRINDETAKITQTLERIHRGLENIDVLPVQAREFIENTIATDLADVYSGIEHIFLRIAREVDMHVPTGHRWQKALLAQMTEQRPERPPVISGTSFLRLAALLDFRHKVTHIYGRQLVYEKTEAQAKSIDELFETVSQELNRFIASLTKRQEDV